MATRPPRDWITIGAIALAGLPGVAALIGLIFAFQAQQATNTQLQIAAQGQITDRYNAAITNLGSPSVDVRLGGIYALQRIMQDSPRDQPTVVAVLCAFIRDRASPATTSSAHSPGLPQTAYGPLQLPTDLQAALTVVGTRNTAYDGSTTVVDFTNVDLSGRFLLDEPLSGAILTGANLSHSILAGAHLNGAAFGLANLADANLYHANLYHAYLGAANLTGAYLGAANLTGAYLFTATLADANLTDANLTDANLTDANLTDANLAHANLTDADLAHADLTDATLTGADLTGATLTGATLTGAKGLPTGTPRPSPGSTPASAKNLCR